MARSRVIPRVRPIVLHLADTPAHCSFKGYVEIMEGGIEREPFIERERLRAAHAINPCRCKDGADLLAWQPQPLHQAVVDLLALRAEPGLDDREEMRPPLARQR